MAVALVLPCSVVVVALDVIMCEGLETLVVNGRWAASMAALVWLSAFCSVPVFTG